jgi:hypothetical protein
MKATNRMHHIKTLTLLLSLAIFAHAQSEALPVKVKVLGSYWANGKVGGTLWHNILVPENIKKDELIAVARALFKDQPGYYRIFTDDKEFHAFIMSDLHYTDSQKENYPYPEKWANKPSVVTSKAAIRGHFKTGQWNAAGTR